MRKSGIYKIRNLTNNKIYVGSAINFSDRKNLHFSQLRRDVHHSILLQRAFNKYGLDNFIFEIIEIIEDTSNLISREQYYIDILNPEYNICRIAGSTLGVESVRKIPVIQYSLTGELIKEWDCLQRIMEHLCITNSTKISDCCKGKRNKAYNFVWRYKESNIPFYIKTKICRKPVAEIDEYGKIINTWERMADCALDLGMTRATLSKITGGKDRQKTFKGRLFKKISIQEYRHIVENN